MNNTFDSLDLNSPPIIYEPQESLTTWGIFLSSLILSLSGGIAVVMSSIKQSRCSKINGCCGLTCTREIIENDINP